MRRNELICSRLICGGGLTLATPLSKLLMGLWFVLSVSVEKMDTVPEPVSDTK